MPYGYNGKILRVNLTEGKVASEELPETFYRLYFGGEGMIGYYLLKEVSAAIDPLGPQNKLVFAAGVMTGVPVGGCGRHCVGGKSPLTGGFGSAESGGYWGTELKMTGIDAIIIEGKAEKPVYLFVNDNKAQIRDAKHLWGMKTLECQAAIRKELDDPLVKVTQIGPAGEKMVLFANISNDLDAFAGRTGLGAVMGSKHLKAVACRGHQRVRLAEPSVVSEIGKWVSENAPINDKSQHEFGTASLIKPLNALGGLPTYNFMSGSFAGADNISGDKISETIFKKRRSCFACPIQCKREVEITEPYTVDPHYGGPEYETLSALGSNCGIDDLKAVAKGNELVNAYGVDSISCGAAISFAMECFERGLLTKKDTGGLDLRFGNAEAMLAMIEQIVERKGLGALLSEGTVRAARKIGAKAEESVLAIKGQEMPMHDPRLKQGFGLGCAMSPTGADHCHNMHDTAFVALSSLMKEMSALGITSPLPANDLSAQKVRLLTYYTQWMHFLNSAVCCYFVVVYGNIGFERMTHLIRSVTGWNVSLFELMRVGERAMNLARVFNIREGFTSDDDLIPKRFFQKQPCGPLEIAIDPETFLQAKETYYRMQGWDNGVPSRAKLAELNIEWAGSYCKRRGILQNQIDVDSNKIN